MHGTLRTLLALPLALGLLTFGGGQALAAEGSSQEGYPVQITIDCAENLAFSRYDVNVIVDDTAVANIDHGTKNTLQLSLAPGNHTLSVEKEDDPSVDGHTSFVVDGKESLSYKVRCTKDQVEVEETVDKPDGLTTGAASSSLDKGSSSTKAKAQAATPTPQDYAERAAVVAMTNRNATDVFTADGSAYDPAKFHSFSDTSGYYMDVVEDGTWSETGANAWHGDGLLLAAQGGYCVKVSLDVSFDGTNYVVSNVTGHGGTLQQIEAGNPDFLESIDEQPSEFASYLTVPASMVAQGRDAQQAAAPETPATPAPEAPAAAPAPAAPAAPAPTMGQKNALSSAKNYLKFMAFSYAGLIEQLEYEGYSAEDATWAADNCEADWSEQAAKSAENYLNFMSFSRDGLIEQLEYEGFTPEEAEYGVTAVGY